MLACDAHTMAVSSESYLLEILIQSLVRNPKFSRQFRRRFPIERPTFRVRGTSAGELRFRFEDGQTARICLGRSPGTNVDSDASKHLHNPKKASSRGAKELASFYRLKDNIASECLKTFICGSMDRVCYIDDYILLRVNSSSRKTTPLATLDVFVREVKTATYLPSHTLVLEALQDERSQNLSNIGGGACYHNLPHAEWTFTSFVLHYGPIVTGRTAVGFTRLIAEQAPFRAKSRLTRLFLGG